MKNKLVRLLIVAGVSLSASIYFYAFGMPFNSVIFLFLIWFVVGLLIFLPNPK